MSSIIIWLFLVLPASVRVPETPEFSVFFTELRAAAENKDIPKLKMLVYPFRDEVEDMQEAMVENIIKGNIEQKGNGVFSIRAQDSLMAHHLDKIAPIEKELYGQRPEEGGVEK